MISPFTKSHEVGSILRQPLLHFSSMAIKTTYLYTMKHYKEIITLICMALVCLSCEKSSEQDTDNPDSNTPENNNTDKKDDNNGNGDNGGWANDDKDNKNDNADYEEWSDGEHVNVTYFINNSLNGEAIWVDGYIVGSATSTDGYKFQFSSPFDYATSILLSDKKNETDKKHVMTIQLKSGSEYRKELNLKDNPELYNKKISICGYKTTYLKLPGMKELLDYEWLK
ncbi:DUF6359 domain-containing protein [Prevotella sp.]|uniref:DUF6359 domain-containing protein n=1 Tax=Prevotella sp. TaxID=59823 RepID=UPI003F7D965F